MSPELEMAAYSIRREQAAAIRRFIDMADGGPIAPTASAVIGALVQMDAEQLEQVRRAVDVARRDDDDCPSCNGPCTGKPIECSRCWAHPMTPRRCHCEGAP